MRSPRIGTSFKPQPLGGDASRYYKQVLAREMQHRLKNLLAIVQAIVVQSFRSSGTKEQTEKAIFARLSALAEAQNMLTLENGQPVSMAAIVERLIRIHATEAARFRIDGPEILLEPQLAMALILILHEMATNALKYGALSNDSGHVELTWQPVAQSARTPALWLRWAETGGPPVTPPRHRGFGTRLIEGLLAPKADVATELVFSQVGVVLTIQAPLAPMCDLTPSAAKTEMFGTVVN
jgi:two-component sensor histidine kinase